MRAVYRTASKNPSPAAGAYQPCINCSAFPVRKAYSSRTSEMREMADNDLIARRKERAERDLTEVTERLCLMCSRKFLSSWKGNRICRRCKHLESDFRIEGPDIIPSRP